MEVSVFFEYGNVGVAVLTWLGVLVMDEFVVWLELAWFHDDVDWDRLQVLLVSHAHCCFSYEVSAGMRGKAGEVVSSAAPCRSCFHIFLVHPLSPSYQ